MNQTTKYEKARMIGARALQISMGAPFLVKVTPEDLEKIGYNPIEIAKKEFDAEALPITIRRPMPKRAETAAVSEAKTASATA
ncbi:MAG: DNA-directed RNA polymerase subunit K [Candidatus Aenigmarchaeota archaeon]|nr:DNA-directed RNA polymerase subunit K [Candidatus Aenigmarchaeota archaeon]